MRAFIRNNWKEMVISLIVIVALMVMLGYDRPRGTIGVECFFPFIYILYWVCKYIDK